MLHTLGYKFRSSLHGKIVQIRCEDIMKEIRTNVSPMNYVIATCAIKGSLILKSSLPLITVRKRSCER